MIDIPQAKDLVKRILLKLGSKYASDHAVNLIIGTMIIESRFKYFRQLGDGPARGFAQLEIDSVLDVNQNWLRFRPTMIDKCVKATYIPKRYFIKGSKADWEYLIETNFAAQVVFSRLLYWRAPAPLPSTMAQYASYWKRFYNTELGSGEASEFVTQVSKYL
jgi:hypothetical protein